MRSTSVPSMKEAGAFFFSDPVTFSLYSFASCTQRVFQISSGHALRVHINQAVEPARSDIRSNGVLLTFFSLDPETFFQTVNIIKLSFVYILFSETLAELNAGQVLLSLNHVARYQTSRIPLQARFRALISRLAGRSGSSGRKYIGFDAICIRC